MYYSRMSELRQSSLQRLLLSVIGSQTDSRQIPRIL